MSKKKVVVALGHKALGATLPQQQDAVKGAAKAIADLVEADCQVIISHSNAPQVGMIQYCYERIRKAAPGLHLRTHICLLCHEPGLYRI